MVNKSNRLDAIFGALSDPTRRGMLAHLAQGSTTIGKLGRPYNITKGAVSKHVKVLEQAGLLRRDVRGRVHHCNLDTRPLDAAQVWFRQVSDRTQLRSVDPGQRP